MLIGSWDDRPRPGHRQLAGVGVVAEQVVGDALAVAAREPRGDQRVDARTSIVGGMIIGRPETTTTTHFAAAAQTVFTAAVSASESCMVFGGRGTLLSPGS